MLKSAIKKIIPESVLLAYHKALAIAANVLYWFPSRKMVVIGVTGTKGKSSTVVMTTRILEEAGYRVGSMNSIFFQVADRDWPNRAKQSMLGRMKLQRFLRRMVHAGCTHAVIEVTSEGIAQHRHHGIVFDVVVFTNLSPEHIEAHGSYIAYRHAKEMIFKNLSATHAKPQVPKVIVVNGSDEAAEKFLRHRADQKWIVYTDPAQARQERAKEHVLVADKIQSAADGTVLTIGERYIHMQIHGRHMAENALLAIATAQSLGVSLSTCEQALEGIDSLPGRSELLVVKKNFQIMVDYAHEPRSFEAVLASARTITPTGKIIVVFGATGGGRDAAKRPVMGAIAARYADYVILTTDDPYDDDPDELISDIAPGVIAEQKHWKEGAQWFRITDRKSAIAKALSLARRNDLVLLLGKGSEQTMIVKGNRAIPWSDKDVVRKLLEE